ncbi:bromodomain-containing protein 8 isoform X4 [Aquarana catesbeiana]|uniref:bromodomain-containing protein 8 isoform X4 n=1 Tax=Aquarana catesbeiana TaxID=8400 RepID=UPI003CC9B43E
MAAGIGKHKLLNAGPTEPWSVREKLCLASSVMRSGDQNWVSVSRAIKPFAEPGRPPDWFSQKHCASQYSELLETTETPKRKRGERGEVVETIEDVIVRKLTAERIEELKKLIKDTQEKYRKLKKEAELIQSGHMDSKLEELWNDVVVKKKQEEEEAELKRKATDAAYQARQAAKNIPRRSSSAIGRSSVGSSSPGGEFGLGDLTPSSTEEGSVGVNEGEMALASNHISGSSVLMDVGVLPNLHGGEMHPVPGTIPASPAASVAQQEDNDSTSDQHTVTVSMDSSDISMIIDSINKECLASSDGSMQNKDESSESKGDLDLAEKMDIAVSYTGEELDFETVGDIIAIIEDKVDDHPEVLDVAAVEAALSFCEENDDPQTLSGPWDHPVQDHSAKSENIAQSLIPRPKDQTCVQTDTLMNIMDMTPEIKSEPPEPEVQPAQSEVTSITPRATFQNEKPEDEMRGTTSNETIKEEEADHQLKTETPQCENSPNEAFPSEEDKGTGSEDNPVLSEPVKAEPTPSSNKDSQAEEEEEEEDVTSEVGSPEEPKEEEAGEEYLSEVDNEPPISESDDGFSIHNAQLQSHTLADSIPSSPASSQFSVCSEDQEAIQAQKIWKKAIMLVWRAAANHRYANVFLQPVTDDIAPGYHSIVQRPMDLSTIKKNIETGIIRTTAEFQRDIMLMFQNAVMYNSSDHDVYHMAVEMQRDVLEQIQQFLATQLIMQTSESGISAKSLRGRDSTRKQDASEKMTPFSEQQTINRVPAICELNTSPDQHKLLELRMNCLGLQEISSAEGQAKDIKLDLSTTSTEVLNVCQNLTQSELHNGKFTEGDHELGSGKRLEKYMDSHICDGIWKSEEEKTCESQPSDTADVRKEFLVSSSQDSTDNKASTDPENMKEDDHPQHCNSVLENDHGSTTLNSENEICIYERTKCVIPRNLPLLELLLVNTKVFKEEEMSFKKKLTPVWKIIATHRPMDLKTIKRCLSQGTIKTKAEFQRDVLLMLQNCIMYNNVQYTLHQKTLEMQRDVVEILQVLNLQMYQRYKTRN